MVTVVHEQMSTSKYSSGMCECAQCMHACARVLFCRPAETRICRFGYQSAVCPLIDNGQERLAYEPCYQPSKISGADTVDDIKHTYEWGESEKEKSIDMALCCTSVFTSVDQHHVNTCIVFPIDSQSLNYVKNKGTRISSNVKMEMTPTITSKETREALADM
ncbi:hypothetical protein BCR41DRAFT_374295 [Lobosporangium transversale]|uniref:Uncharacterized protein n=1 Tax=Lobosporangium transversale TaxID=64571 RepID=A0A1Y2GCJ1_9FUNG|nr:hypothetical protein BCR41DRAFT_374295 [Lobosporangium transversale]ORZ05962.1 hypothetical protein BCR41DRAFT_374295 [Lobosporangium transversale]|eukprot:XP_021877343.1 hypothetical protein BCR41DRAFT_374295 [Lobosporangium transversale]